VLLHDPSARSSRTARTSSSRALAEASGSRSASTARAPAAARSPRARGARAGADLIACAVYPIALTLHRVSGEALASALAALGMDTGVDVDALAGRELVDEFIGDEPVTPLAPRIAVRAAQHELRPASSRARPRLRAHGATDRLDEVLDELRRSAARPARRRSRRRSARSSPRRRSSTSSRRRATRPSSTSCATCSRAVRDAPGEIDPTSSGPSRSSPATRGRRARRARRRARRGEGLAASEEELLLLALFGEEAEPLLRAIRDRSSGEDLARRRGRPDAGRADPRGRAIGQETASRDRGRGGGDAGLVKRTEEPARPRRARRGRSGVPAGAAPERSP
jgi:hypothetical protein